MNNMGCYICGRGSCAWFFHRASEQDRFTKVIALFEQAEGLRIATHAKLDKEAEEQACKEEREAYGTMNTRDAIRSLQSRVAQLERAFQHRHINNGLGDKNDDSCKQCGLDLRDSIHFMKAQS